MSGEPSRPSDLSCQSEEQRRHIKAGRHRRRLHHKASIRRHQNTGARWTHSASRLASCSHLVSCCYCESVEPAHGGEDGRIRLCVGVFPDLVCVGACPEEAGTKALQVLEAPEGSRDCMWCFTTNGH